MENSNVKFINTGKRKLCLVLVDKQLQGFFFDEEEYSLVGWYDDIHYESYKLPTEFKYGFIKPSNEITEEQANKFVGERLGFVFGYKNFLNHGKKYGSYNCGTALESFKSLLQANECCSENPYGYKPDVSKFNNDTEWSEHFHKWRKAEQNVGNWIVLEVIK